MVSLVVFFGPGSWFVRNEVFIYEFFAFGVHIVLIRHITFIERLLIVVVLVPDGFWLMLLMVLIRGQIGYFRL